MFSIDIFVKHAILLLPKEQAIFAVDSHGKSAVWRIARRKESGMKYCTKCGAELHDEAVVCPRCGCATSDYKAHSSKIDDMTLLIKIFMIIGCVCSGFGLLLPLAWTIPMTVVFVVGWTITSRSAQA